MPARSRCLPASSPAAGSRLVGVDAHQHVHTIARVRTADAKELAHMFKALPIERRVERMGRVVQLDEDAFVLSQMGRTTTTQHHAKFGPGLAGSVFEIGERHGRAVDAEQPASGQYKLEQVLAQDRVGEQVPYRVVQTDGVELRKMLFFEYGWIIGNERGKRAGPFAHHS